MAAPRLSGGSRHAGKSDPIDARAVAQAVRRDGIESFPVAFTDQHALEIRVLCDYRDQIIIERTRMINRLRWHVVTIAPELEARLGPASLGGPRMSWSSITSKRSEMPGSAISAVEVTNISQHGFWVLIDGRELFLPYSDLPRSSKPPSKRSCRFSDLAHSTVTGQSLMSISLSTRSSTRSATPLVSEA